jgi:hypothetical protein
MISDDPEDYSNKTTNNKNNKNDASSVSLLSNATSEQSDLNESRDENLIDYEPLFLQVSISIRHGKDTMITAPISQLPTCLVDLFKVRIFVSYFPSILSNFLTKKPSNFAKLQFLNDRNDKNTSFAKLPSANLIFCIIVNSTIQELKF